MKNHYILWATGADQPGIVASVTKTLFEKNCNLEDSSMMQLGSQFGILLIFSSKNNFSVLELEKFFQPLQTKMGLKVGLKKISAKQAKSKPAPKHPYIVSVHGIDQKGIVYKVTHCLSRFKFNISDLSTHRTGSGKKAGFILLVEGEFSGSNKATALAKALKNLQTKLRNRISIQPISSQRF